MEIKWTTNAYSDYKDIMQYSEKYYGMTYKILSQIESTLDLIRYNPKSGKKDFNNTDIPEYNIRYLAITKYCFLYYTEIPDGVLILALQNSEKPLEIQRKYKKIKLKKDSEDN